MLFFTRYTCTRSWAAREDGKILIKYQHGTATRDYFQEIGILCCFSYEPTSSRQKPVWLPKKNEQELQTIYWGVQLYWWIVLKLFPTRYTRFLILRLTLSSVKVCENGCFITPSIFLFGHGWLNRKSYDEHKSLITARWRFEIFWLTRHSFLWQAGAMLHNPFFSFI